MILESAAQTVAAEKHLLRVDFPRDHKNVQYRLVV